MGFWIDLVSKGSTEEVERHHGSGLTKAIDDQTHTKQVNAYLKRRTMLSLVSTSSGRVFVVFREYYSTGNPICIEEEYHYDNGKWECVSQQECPNTSAPREPVLWLSRF
jgi:hypothetical protein